MLKKINLLLTLLCITTGSLYSSEDTCVPNLESNIVTSDFAVNPNDDHYVPDLARTRVNSDDSEDPSPTYTFNFMTLNPYLGEYSSANPRTGKYESETNILSLLYKTAGTIAKHKGSVNLWIDSESISREVVDRFSQKFTSYGTQNPYYAPIFIRDIRTLEQVKKTPEVFSSNFPKKFRSDLLRVIATLETLKKSKESYFVYSDLTLVKPLRHEKLFTPKVRKFLDIYGLVFQGIHTDDDAEVIDDTWFENRFHIVSKDDKDTHEALQHVVVDLNIARAQAISPARRKELKAVPQYSHVFMLDYLQSFKGLGTLLNKITNQPYDKDIDGFEPYSIVPNGDSDYPYRYNLRAKTNSAACQQYFGCNHAPKPVTFKPKHHFDPRNIISWELSW